MDSFARFRIRLLVQVILSVLITLAVAGFLVVFLVDGVLQEPFIWLFYGFFSFLLGSEEEAALLYQMVFRENKAFWIGLGSLLLLVAALYLSLGQVIRYFREVSRGIDRLAEESKEEILLPPSLRFIELRLRETQHKLRQRDQAARAAEQRKNDLVVYLAHDIKTPLTSVIGYLSLLTEAPDMPPQQRAEYLRITLEKALRLEQLVGEFFEITRFNLQAVTLEPKVIDLPFMLEQMVDEFYPALSGQHKRAVVRAQRGLRLWGDPDKLARVFNNILKNAVAYSIPGSTIDIVAAGRGEQIAIRFSNRGVHIPQEQLDAIFEKFYRLDSARSSYTGGAGLGLSIAREIVLAHGGAIQAESDETSTRFTVILPAAPAGKVDASADA